MKLEDQIKIIPRKLIKDDRGWFLKAITGTEEHIPSHTGEIYFTCATPGQIKASHYHEVAQEWFTLITGRVILKLQDINTLEKVDIEMNADNPVTVYVPAFVAHTLVNSFDTDFILCAYTDVLFDPKDTIAYIIE